MADLKIKRKPYECWECEKKCNTLYLRGHEVRDWGREWVCLECYGIYKNKYLSTDSPCNFPINNI